MWSGIRDMDEMRRDSCMWVGDLSYGCRGIRELWHLGRGQRAG
jgi:hypothetical protein